VTDLTEEPISLATALLTGLEDQAQVEAYGEGTVTITGPIDLEELADFVGKTLFPRAAPTPPSDADLVTPDRYEQTGE
jgi:hypothetical protein